MTHISGEAQCRRGRPSASTAIQSGCAACTSSYVACGSVRASTTIPSLRQPATSSPKTSRSPSQALRWWKGTCGRVVRDAAAGAEADAVGARAPEVVEPEADVELRRIVLDERELRPAHRPVDPRRRREPGCGPGRRGRARHRPGRHGRGRRGAERDGGSGEGGGLQETAASCAHLRIVPPMLVARRPASFDPSASRVSPTSRSGTSWCRLCHLANIAYRPGRIVHWDAAKEQVVGEQTADGVGSRAVARRSPARPMRLSSRL